MLIALIHSILSVVLYGILWFGWGSVVLTLLRIKLVGIQRGIVAIFTGISTSLLLFDVSTYFSSPIIRLGLFWLLIVIGAVYLIRQRHGYSMAAARLRSSLKKQKLTMILAVVVITVSSLTIALSWMPGSSELRFQQGVLHDSVWHIALIRELQAGIPAKHPSSFNDVLTNYHYYYDLLLATTSSATGVAVTLLHYQVFPVLLSSLLVLGIVLLCRAISTDQRLIQLSLFFTFFGGNAGFLIPFFLNRSEWGESTFWVSQTFSMMINPQLILSLAIIAALIALLLHYIKRPERAAIIVSILLSLSLAGIKVYGFAIAIALVGLVICWQLIITRKKEYLFWIVAVLISATGMFLKFADITKATLIFEPLWFIDTMVEAPDRLNIVDWKLREEHYLANGGYLRYIELKSKEILIFYGGNLGSRVLMFAIPILLWLDRRSKVKHKEQLSFIIVLVFGFLVSTTVPLLFIQSGVVWNTIQFWYYGLFFASLLAAYATCSISRRLEARSWLSFVFIIVVICATIPAWVKTIPKQISTFEVISPNIVAGLSSTNSLDRVAVCTSGDAASYIFDTSLARALGNGEVYLANPVQLELLGLNGYQREKLYREQLGSASGVAQLVADHELTTLICDDQAWLRQLKDMAELHDLRLISI